MHQGARYRAGCHRAARRARSIRAFSPSQAIAGMAMCSTAICPMCRILAARRIVAIPLATDVNDMPFMKHGNPPELMRRSFEENLSIAREEAGPSVIDVTVHAHIFGRPRGARVFRDIVRAAATSPDVWLATRLQMAEFVFQKHQSENQ